MTKPSNHSRKARPFWLGLVAAGLWTNTAQAGEDVTQMFQRLWQSREALQSYQLSLLFGIFSLLCLLAAAWTWRKAREWRARVVRERDEQIRRLIDESTKSLQREVAEREAAQRALQENQETTLRQERLAAVGQMAAGLAHEFNNILTIIQGHASLLLDDPRMDEQSIQSIKHITDGVERTAALVKQMLAFSRKQVMQLKAIYIQDTLNQIRDMLGQLLGAHVVLCFDLSPKLPPIKADSEMLQQILVNLAVNAREAMKEGGQLTIKAEEVALTAEDRVGKPERREGKFVQLSVMDTGHGMDARTVAHLFEPFFTTKDVGQNTGLGLATVYGMVNQNAGWIEVDSDVGVGTTFYIYLPVSDALPEAPSPVAAHTAPAAPRRAKETILVVEDETMLRELVREILEASGYHVLDAASGQEALALWSEHAKDVKLLLTDVSMPDGMSGRELAARLQKENPRLPVILSSGYNQENLEEKVPMSSGQTFLTKPYQPTDLTDAIRACLENASPVP
jgi:signal transduction histidine kinase/CheY-like chemotaxis protein